MQFTVIFYHQQTLESPEHYFSGVRIHLGLWVCNSDAVLLAAFQNKLLYRNATFTCWKLTQLCIAIIWFLFYKIIGRWNKMGKFRAAKLAWRLWALLKKKKLHEIMILSYKFIKLLCYLHLMKIHFCQQHVYNFRMSKIVYAIHRHNDSRVRFIFQHFHPLPRVHLSSGHLCLAPFNMS